MAVLHYGDCLDIMPTLPDASVDAIIADPPYGTTSCKWDSVIPLAPMWAELKRVIKPRGAIVLFAAQPFTSALVMSNAEWFRYDLIWDKVNKYTGYPNASKMPLRIHEHICIFARGLTTYNRQFRVGKPYKSKVFSDNQGEHLGRNGLTKRVIENDGNHNPSSIIPIKAKRNLENGLHPTQKPVDLLRYLVRTYTNAGETVLDFTMGSGTTGVACAMESRNFIGIELERKYYDIAERRISEAQIDLPLLAMVEA